MTMSQQNTSGLDVNIKQLDIAFQKNVFDNDNKRIIGQEILYDYYVGNKEAIISNVAGVSKRTGIGRGR